MFFENWLKGALCGLIVSLVSNFFYSNLSTLFSIVFLFFFFLKIFGKKNILLLFCSGFLWTSSFNQTTSSKDKISYPLSFLDSYGKSYKEKAKKWVKQKLKKNNDLSPWLHSLILGERRFLNQEIKATFSYLGLYHLLVLSGLHVTIFTFCIFSFCYTPLLLLYSLRLINCGIFLALQDYLRIIVCFCLLFYAYLVDFPPSVQRASLFAIVALIQPILLYSFLLKDKLILVLFVQVFIFPTNFLSQSTLLSWGSMLLILDKRQKDSFFNLIKTQTLLTLLVAGVCGKLSLIGIAVNLFLIPLFSFAYILALSPLLDSLLPPFMVSLALEFQKVFLLFLKSLAVLPQYYSWLYIDLFEYHYLARFLIILGLTYYFTILVHRFQSS